MNLLGLYNVANADYNVLVNNGKIVHKSGLSILHKYGIRNDSTTVLLDDSLVGKGIVTGELSDSPQGIKLDNTPFETDGKKVAINIDDYNSINDNLPTSGCVSYNPKAKYSILDAYLKENTETSATFSKEECPKIHVKFTEPRIKRGQYLKVPYFVDNHYADSIRRFTIGDTFTVIITDSKGTELYKRTHYAGEYTAHIGPFNTEGSQWFEIKAIDQDGCGSPSVFFDVMVDSTAALNLKDISYDDLASYDITEGQGSTDDDTKEMEAYINKLGFSALYADAKAEGYDGVRLPKNAWFNFTYCRNEIKTARRASPRNRQGDIELSNIKFYKVKLRAGTTTDEYTYTEVIKLDWTTFHNECLTYVWNNWDSSKVLWSNYKKTDGMYFPTGPIYALPQGVDGNTLDDAKKALYFLKTPQKTGSIPVIGGKMLPHGSNGIPDVACTGTNGYLYIMVVKEVTEGPYVKNFDNLTDDNYWEGDSVVIPDNFTIDMNGSTFRAINTSVYWKKGTLVWFNDNINSKLINGRLEGPFADYYVQDNIDRFFAAKWGVPDRLYWNVPSKLIAFIPLPAPGEGASNVWISNSEHCVVENVEIVHSMGYEFAIEYKKIGTPPKIESEWENYGDNLSEFIDNFRNEIMSSDLPSEVKNDFPFEKLDRDVIDCMSITKLKTLSRTNIGSFNTLFTTYNEGGSGEAMQYGRRRHYIILCYANRNNNVVLNRIIKTGNGEHVRIPTNIKYVKLLVYGRSGEFYTSDDDIYTGSNYPKPPTIWRFQPSVNAFVRNCYIHDTRTCVIHPAASTGTVFKDCTFENVAVAESRVPFLNLTPYLGDFEEGLVAVGRTSLYNCRYILGAEGKTNITVKQPYQLNVEHSVNIAMQNIGTFDAVIVTDSVLEGLQYFPTSNSYAGHVLIRDSVIDKSSKFWYSKVDFFDDRGVKKYKHYSKLDRIIGMRDVIINNHITYNRFNFHRVRNGKQIFD